jgi:hypothetical protein
MRKKIVDFFATIGLIVSCGTRIHLSLLQDTHDKCTDRNYKLHSSSIFSNNLLSRHMRRQPLVFVSSCPTDLCRQRRPVNSWSGVSQTADNRLTSPRREVMGSPVLMGLFVFCCLRLVTLKSSVFLIAVVD